MLMNYLIVTLRNLLRNRTYSAINVIGLAVGMISFILISLWVKDELSYDKFHNNVDNLYRVIDYEKYSSGEEVYFSQNSALLGPILKSDYPEIIDFTRVRGERSYIVNYHEKSINQDGIMFADPSLFDLFSFDIIKGNKKSILSDPYSIALTEEMAEKYFGNDDPIGKTLQLDKRFDFNVSGIIKDYHFQSLHDEIKPQIIYYNAEPPQYMIVKLISGNLIDKIKSLEKLWASINPGYPFEFEFIEEYQERMYRTDLKVEKIINIFTIMALFIACLGLFGLTSFVAEQRTKEIGVRKVLGASIWGILVLLNKEFSKWIILANIIALPIMYIEMNSWLESFAYRIEINWWLFFMAGFVALIISALVVSVQTIKAYLANPVESLRDE